MTRLYDIAIEIRQIIETSETGELTPDVLDKLEDLEWSLERKVDAYCVLRAEAQGRIAARKAEIDRLQAANKTDDNAENRLVQSLLNGLQLAGTKRVETTRFKVWIQTGPSSIAVDVPAEKLDPEYWRTIIEVDKKLLAEIAKKGGTLPEGVREVDGREYLRIK